MDLHRFLDAPLLMDERAAARILMRLTKQARGLKPDSESDAEEVQTRLPTLWPGERITLFDQAPQPAPQPQAAAIGSDGKTRSYTILNHVALIPIEGVLVSGLGGPGETGYGAVAQQIAEAVEDDDVGAIAMQISSPGGEVSGLFDLADTITAVSGDKPIWSILDDHAYSAAYAIAAVGDHVTVPRTGGTGSIGVITMHLDMSKFMENLGLNVKIIQYGERKSDYSPFKPLSQDAQARLQHDVDAVGEMFVRMVAKNRNLAHSRVRSTEAGIFMGQDGVDAGLADAVMSPADAFGALVRRIS